MDGKSIPVDKIQIDGDKRDLGEYSLELLKEDFPLYVEGVKKEYWPRFIQDKFAKNRYDKDKSLKNNLKAINKDLKLSEKEMKDLKEYLLGRFGCPAPEPEINKNKDSILYIALNPAGDDKDAERDRCTGSLFLNYYPEFNCNKKGEPKLSATIKQQNKRTDGKKALTYTSFYKAIEIFFENLVGVGPIAWEWCNIPLDELIYRIEKYYKSIDDGDKKCLDKCLGIYNKGEYQIIERDLVYYHQTSSFDSLLEEPTKDETKKIVKNMIDHYIKMFKKKDAKLSLIYISSATACHYVKEALYDKGVFKNYVGLEYDNIPVVFAGSELSGQRSLDIYSKSRLAYSIRELLERSKDISKEACLDHKPKKSK